MLADEFCREHEAFTRACLEYSKTDIFRTRVKSARDIILKARELADELGGRLYVAVSGGKDSTVLLHLVDTTIADYDVFHWDHGPYLMPREVEREVINIIRTLARRARRIVVETSRKLWQPRARWDYRIWYRAFFGKLHVLARKHDWRVGLLGLRAEEGIERRKRASKVFERKGKVILCYPLWDWTYLDVWAYIFSRKVPYCSVYDRLARICGWDKARLVTFFDHEFAHFGNVEMSKFLFPHEINI